MLLEYDLALTHYFIVCFISQLHTHTDDDEQPALQKRFDQWIWLQRYREEALFIVTLKKIEESKISFSFICLTCQASLLQIYEKNHLIPKTFDRFCILTQIEMIKISPLHFTLKCTNRLIYFTEKWFVLIFLISLFLFVIINSRTPNENIQFIVTS